MYLAKNIRYLRKKQGWGQDQLAEKLGYKSYTTIQKWESGVSEPPLKVVHQLASVFSVDIDDLARINLEEAKKTPTVSDGLILDHICEEDVKTIKAFLAMPDDQRKALAKILGISE